MTIPLLDAHVIRVIRNQQEVVWQYGASHFAKNIQKALDFFNGKGNQVQYNVVGTVGIDLEVLMIRNPKPFDLEHFNHQLNKCVFMDPAEHDRLISIYAPSGQMTPAERDAFVRSDHGYLERHTSAAILPFIYVSQAPTLALWPPMDGATDKSITIDLDTSEFIHTDGTEEGTHSYSLSDLPESWV